MTVEVTGAAPVEYTLKSKYEADSGRVFLSGTQAMVRLILEQLKRDQRANLNTSAFVSGYPGSPLGGLDLELARQKKIVDEAGIRFVPGHNEELAATAVWGSQVAQTFDDATHDGVTGYWYGKGPGLDRASDAIRHAQYIGTSRAGGVVAFVGDDPACKSSSIPNSSEQTLMDLGVPTVAPVDVADVLELGRHAVAMSRSSGLWSAIRIVTTVADGTMSVDLTADVPDVVIPELEWKGEPFVPTLNSIPCPPWSIAVEAEVVGPRVEMAREYGYLNNLNRVVARSDNDWIGLAVVGHQLGEVYSALAKIGIDEQDFSDLGIRVLSIRQPYPMHPRTIHEFADGLSEIFVIEEKRPMVETMVRDFLYGQSHQPLVVGKKTETGAELLPMISALDSDVLLPRLRSRLAQRVPEERMRPPGPRIPTLLPIIDAKRAPYFCSGCPHNTSTRVPDGALASGGIGCHSMAQFMEPEITGVTASMTHMGSEGAQWIGIEPFVQAKHMFQNIGDGTFFHSGQLSLQASIAAGSNITFKILVNDVIAMTGGQDPHESNAVAVPRLVKILRTQGVKRIIITSDEPHKYRGVRLPRGVKVWDRSRIIEAQETLATVSGVTVLIHDQRCAAENRRDRKRKKIETPNKRIFINERVCEGCGDCGAKSNCLSVEPVDTEYGRKTQINQESCNLDFSCVQGDCPSFIEVTLPKNAQKVAAKRDKKLSKFLTSAIANPQVPAAGNGFVIRMPGIGGTGVVTASQILGTAALLDGKASRGLDQTGLSQKAGPVISDITVADHEFTSSNKASADSVDLVLGFDILGVGDAATAASTKPGSTYAVVSTSRTPTGAMVSDVRSEWPAEQPFIAALLERLGDDKVELLDAQHITSSVLGSAAGVNIFMIGVAFQLGALPITAESLEQAITLNGVAVDANIEAFRAGRQWIANRERLMSFQQVDELAVAPVKDSGVTVAFAGLDAHPDVLERAQARAGELIAYQNLPYALKFARTIDRVAQAEERALPGSRAYTRAVIESVFKLMAYKDEYEVARLSLDPTVKQEIERLFGPGTKAKWKLHPPILRDRGMKNKLSLGAWFGPAFHVLYALRRLRGTPFDIFGYTPVRKMERELRDEFIDVVTQVAEELDVSSLQIAIEVAELPDMIRGYESIKEDNVERYRVELESALQRFRVQTNA